MEESRVPDSENPEPAGGAPGSGSAPEPAPSPSTGSPGQPGAMPPRDAGPPEGEPLPSTADERMWALIAHLVGIPFLFSGFPFAGPLIVWLIKKDDSPFVADQAKEALNFQIVACVALWIALVSMFACIGVVLVPLVCIGVLVLSIVAAIKSYDGVRYRYPYIPRLL